MKFVILRAPNGKAIYVNPDHVASVRKNSKTGQCSVQLLDERILVAGGFKDLIRVLEGDLVLKFDEEEKEAPVAKPTPPKSVSTPASPPLHPVKKPFDALGKIKSPSPLPKS